MYNLMAALLFFLTFGVSFAEDPIVLKGVTATVFSDTRVAGSRTICPDCTKGVALPTTRALGQIVKVHCIDTDVTVSAPVVDVGPWNRWDHGILHGDRPKAEKGISDLKRYHYRAGNRAGIDITPALHRALGLPRGTRKFLVDITIPKVELGD